MPSDLAKQYHSITFGDKNTWDDWHLVPTERPHITPPEAKTNYVDVPGGNGSLDLSTALAGHPTFKNREGSIEFMVLRFEPARYYHWYEQYSDIMAYLHGKQMKAILNDDPGYYYEGRFFVEDWNSSDKDYSHITIKYNVKPFKMNLTSSLDRNWLWDPFNFNRDSMLYTAFHEIEIPSDEEYTTFEFTKRLFDEQPICPKFIVQSDSGTGMDVIFKNDADSYEVEAHLPEGESFLYEANIYNGGCTIKFKGKGKVSIYYRNGRL